MTDIMTDPKTIERIETARAEVRRAIASDTIILIHYFDMCKLLANPTTMDAVIVHIDQRQYIVVDGSAYRVTSDVKNSTKLNDMMAKVEPRCCTSGGNSSCKNL